MNGSDKTLAGFLEQIAHHLGALSSIAAALGAPGAGGAQSSTSYKKPGRTGPSSVNWGGLSASVPKNAFAYPGEEIFILQGVANGKVRANGRGINVSADLWTFDGEHVATKILNAETSAKTMEDLLRVPPTPRISLDDQNPVEEIQPTTLKKAQWTFNDGSSLTAIGKGVSHIWQLRDGSTVNADAALMVVTSGTGRFEGVQGIASTEGITYTPAGSPNPFANPGGPLRNQHTIEVFKLSLGELVKR